MGEGHCFEFPGRTSGVNCLLYCPSLIQSLAAASGRGAKTRACCRHTNLSLAGLFENVDPLTFYADPISKHD